MFKKSLLTLLFVSGAALAQTTVPSGHYTIVPEESRIEIKTGTAGMFGFAGHSHTILPSVFSGDIDIHPQRQTGTAITIRISSPSLKETGDFSEKDRQEIESQMHGSVLESAKFPEILFQSTSVRYTDTAGHIYDAVIEGDLTLHGMTRRISVPARVTMDGNLLRATGAFKINRPDYHIETKSAGGGTVKVAKVIDIQFEFLLKPQ
jgi:polyisoprenoid-binding protein YceI